jgi:hypothetical protein
MAMVEPEGAVPALQAVDKLHREHPFCPYLETSREATCLDWRWRGSVACYICGYKRGLDEGYDDGYAEGRDEGYERGIDDARERLEWEAENDSEMD